MASGGERRGGPQVPGPAQVPSGRMWKKEALAVGGVMKWTVGKWSGLRGWGGKSRGELKREAVV